MSTKHTTEPWELVLSEDGEEIHIQSKDGMVAKVDRYFLCNREENTHEANAQRIVDCVNAFQGIDEPKDFPILGMVAEMENLEKKLKATIFALNAVVAVGKGHAPSVGYMDEIIGKAEKALAVALKKEVQGA